MYEDRLEEGETASSMPSRQVVAAIGRGHRGQLSPRATVTEGNCLPRCPRHKPPEEREEVAFGGDIGDIGMCMHMLHL